MRRKGVECVNVEIPKKKKRLGGRGKITGKGSEGECLIFCLIWEMNVEDGEGMG